MVFSFLGMKAQTPKTDTAVITAPPDFSVRMMAEWEELQSIAVTWDLEFAPFKKKVLADIIKAAKEEVEVLIICAGAFSNDVTGRVEWELRNMGFENTDNLIFTEADFDKRVWVRDFGAHTIYKNDVEQRLLLDWIYPSNNPSADEFAPISMSDFLSGTDLYTTSIAPYDFKFDGGNLLTDGLGLAIASTHLLEDNIKYDESTIDWIMESFSGVDNFIKLKKLPFNGIHHVDMYMKMIDEETILIGEFPDSIADGPQIEANIEHLLSNYKTHFGNDFEIHRIPMPADQNGLYADERDIPCSNLGTGCYYTYTNALFINELILVPIYFDGEGTDKVALEIWEELMPGYKIVGIDCSEIIKEYGAVHCITKEIGVAEPLRIVHEKVKSICDNEEKAVSAKVQHLSGIEKVNINFSVNGSHTFQQIPMTQSIDNQWIAIFPSFSKNDTISYFIEAFAKNGKVINRPIVGEKGPWKFNVDCNLSSVNKSEVHRLNISPNPTKGFLNISSKNNEKIKVALFDQLGKLVFTQDELNTPSKIDISNCQNGIYNLKIQTKDFISTQKVVKH